MEGRISPTLRFSDVVENYIKFRPGYPSDIVSMLNEKIGLTPASLLADIGSGTGKSSELFLPNKNIVYGVEPNEAMREAAEVYLADHSNFRSIKGKAEDTKLASNSIDIIISGQAFHWFNQPETRKEFSRILKPDGWVVLIWNERNNETPFLQEYENFLLENSIDYLDVNHKNVDETTLANFFGANSFRQEQLPYFQHFNLEGLKGRYLSCSYAYKRYHPLFEEAMKKLQKLYEKHAKEGLLKMDYTTRIYFGQLV